jgi:hypothetical protein
MGADIVADGGAYEADFLIVAVGADNDMDATPGLAEANETASAMCSPVSPVEKR